MRKGRNYRRPEHYAVHFNTPTPNAGAPANSRLGAPLRGGQGKIQGKYHFRDAAEMIVRRR